MVRSLWSRRRLEKAVLLEHLILRNACWAKKPGCCAPGYTSCSRAA